QPFFSEAERVRNESVITVTGNVVERTPETVNPNLPTGAIEVVAAAFHIESQSELLPFPVNQDVEAPEETRLAHRFLDLRRERLHQNIILRSKVAALTRAHLT